MRVKEGRKNGEEQHRMIRALKKQERQRGKKEG